MTLPQEIMLPLPKKEEAEGEAIVNDDYIKELVNDLQEIYRDTTEVVNGSWDTFEPVLKDTASAAEYTYTRQFGVYVRNGLTIDYWFDVQWSAIVPPPSPVPTGNLYIELPYVSLDMGGMPFPGVLQTSTLAYGAGLTVLTINAIPNTSRGEIWGSGDGATMANVTANTAAGTLIGHIRYAGQEFT